MPAIGSAPASSGSNGKGKAIDKMDALLQIGRGSETYLMAMRAAKRACLDFLGISAEDFSGLTLADRTAILAVARAAADTNVIRWEKVGAVAFIGIEDTINGLRTDGEHGKSMGQLKRALTGELVARPVVPAGLGRGDGKAAPAAEPAAQGELEEEDDDLPF
jgi:hypothetical protein